MKTHFDESLLKYTIPASILTGLTIILWVDQSIIPRIEVVIGLCLLLLTIVIFTKNRKKANILWDAQNGILATLSDWNVEVSAYRQLGNVPLGIDLTHSAERVLESMSIHYSSDDRAFVRFFVSRPLRTGKTLVGFSVHRQSFCLLNRISKATKLSEELLVDIEVLESAMRSAYPHVAVIQTNPNHSRSISTGGILDGSS